MDIFYDVEYLNKILTRFTNILPELDQVEYLSQYIQLVLESLYIFTSLKTLFALHIVIHHCFVNHVIFVSMIVSLVRGLPDHTPTFSKFNNHNNKSK